MDRLYLIDGHSLIFRMYYAFMRRPMINSKGEDTSILFGFTKFLLELIRKEQPTHLAVAFDPPAKTFRHELDPEYKANRMAAPELVKAALEPLTEIVRALDIPVVMKPGFEADDVIGSLAKQAAKLLEGNFDIEIVERHHNKKIDAPSGTALPQRLRCSRNPTAVPLWSAPVFRL